MESHHHFDVPLKGPDFLLFSIYNYVSLKMGAQRLKHLLASVCNARDLGSIPGLGRSLGEGNGSPLKYSCLKNYMDRGVWQDTVYGSQRVGHSLAHRYTHTVVTFSDEIFIISLH